MEPHRNMRLAYGTVTCTSCAMLGTGITYNYTDISHSNKVATYNAFELYNMKNGHIYFVSLATITFVFVRDNDVTLRIPFYFRFLFL